MATKTFKIGENAVGGKIKITITGKLIQVQALDYFSNKQVSSGSAISNEEGAYWKLKDYLNDLSTSYYAEKCLEWILKQSDVKKELFKNF